MSLVNGATLEMVRNILNGTTPPAKATTAASCTGNSATASAFDSAKAVTLTGDVTGTVSSTGGWAIETTLAASGVTAGTYGPSASATTNSFIVPQITVDSKGRVTAVTTRTITVSGSSISTPVTVANGGTGRTSFTAYGLVRAGASSTAALQSIANGDSGSVLVSNGASAAPSWKNLYVHHITMRVSVSNATGYATCTVISSRSTAYDNESLAEYLYSNGFSSASNCHEGSATFGTCGYFADSASSFFIVAGLSSYIQGSEVYAPIRNDNIISLGGV